MTTYEEQSLAELRGINNLLVLIVEHLRTNVTPAPEPQQIPELRFDPTNTKNFGLTGTLVGSIRADIDELWKDFHATRMFPKFQGDVTLRLFQRLIDIVDRLEQRPPSILTLTTPTNPVIFPTIAPQPWQPVPNSFPTKPYVGDPPGFPGSGTICSSVKTESVNDATGVSNEGTEEPL